MINNKTEKTLLVKKYNLEQRCRPQYISNGVKKGFSLIEVIVYIAVLSMVFGLFTSIVLYVNRSYARLAVVRSMDISAISSLDRLSRAIRSSSGVVTSQSTLGSTPGVLSLNQTSSSGITINTLFQVTGQNIQIKIDNIDQGNLLPTGVIVSKLVFNLVDSGKSQAISTQLQLEGRVGSSTLKETYYSTEILRGSYK
jgi:prepilin-type N-terminal cleavage/methylation domain-containing protein